jgi:hypothetical protein
MTGGARPSASAGRRTPGRGCWATLGCAHGDGLQRQGDCALGRGGWLGRCERRADAGETQGARADLRSWASKQNGLRRRGPGRVVSFFLFFFLILFPF